MKITNNMKRLKTDIQTAVQQFGGGVDKVTTHVTAVFASRAASLNHVYIISTWPAVRAYSCVTIVGI